MKIYVKHPRICSTTIRGELVKVWNELEITRSWPWQTIQLPEELDTCPAFSTLNNLCNDAQF